MRDYEKPDVVGAPIGSDDDVENVARDISSREIQAMTIAGEPFGDRRQRLMEIISEIEARIDASPRGEDLEPLLQEARAALHIVEEWERRENGGR